MDVRKECECGSKNVQFHLRDNVMIPEVIAKLFCPRCPGDAKFSEKTMLNDNGWIIEYDMDLAKMLAVQQLTIDPNLVDPTFIFDQGYACWQELYPGEKTDIKDEKEKIIQLLQVDQKKYLETIQSWNIERIKKLKAIGWRKLVQA